MKESKRTVFEFKIYGNEYKVSAPTMRQLRDFKKKVDAAPESEIDLSVAFLEGLGIPEEDAWDMEPSHLTEVISTVSGQKKS